MKDISQLQNVVLDQDKLGALVRQTERDYLKQLLSVGDSQVANLRRGERKPSADGLLRLMMLYGVKPEDIATVKIG